MVHGMHMKSLADMVYAWYTHHMPHAIFGAKMCTQLHFRFQVHLKGGGER
jgi:hypothetical protein